jgi:outer membrane immunogenic protein
MRNILLATVAFAALTGVAFAGDLPSNKEAPVFVPPPPVFTWTGFYVG